MGQRGPRELGSPRFGVFSWEGARLLLGAFLPISVRQRLFLGVTGVFLVCYAAGTLLPFALVLPIFLTGVHVLLVRLMDKPMKSLLQIARHGGFDLTGPHKIVEGRDEFSRIARAVYGMAKRMQRSIMETREQTSRIDEIFGAIGEGVVIVSQDGKIQKINHTARRWIGWYGDVTGRRVVEVFRNVELAERIAAMGRKCLENDDERLIEPEIIESLHLEGPESKRVRAKVVAVRTEREHTVFLVFLFDVTDLHRLEQIRREFFANVSHELKTPISAIRGYAEILSDLPGVDENETAKNFVSVITRNTESLTKLIDEMLTLAGLESGTLILNIRPYDVHAGLRRLVENILPKAREANVEIQLDVAEEVRELNVDAQRFESVVLNLLDNGIKYNRPGGYVKVSIRQTQTHHFLYVEDSGTGIPDAAQLRAFERFYRVDKSHTRLGGGSGLGLAIVKHVVLAHGGNIGLRSELGVGTVFTVSLPRHPGGKKIEVLTPL